MAYTDGESKILARIRLHSDYNTSNTDVNDWGILDTGQSAYYAILRPAEDPAEIENITLSAYVIAWQTVVEVWRRYVDDGTTAANLFADVQKIITQMQAYKTLGLSNVQNATITSITPPMKMFPRMENGPEWLKQELTITWLEEITVTYV